MVLKNMRQIEKEGGQHVVVDKKKIVTNLEDSLNFANQLVWR